MSKPKTCSKCGAIFTTPQGLALHARNAGEDSALCDISRTIDMMPTPREMKALLAHGAFSKVQALYIITEIYRPLLALVSALNDREDGG